MVIYVLEHYMALTQMITLRLTKHLNEKAILICVSDNDTIVAKTPLFDNLKNVGVFDDVIALVEIPLKGLSEEQTIQQIVTSYSPVMEQHQLNLHAATAIYEHWDWYVSFALFLDYQNIPFTQVEPLPNNTHYFYHRPAEFHKKNFVSKAYSNLYENIYKMDKNDKPTGNIMLHAETIFFDDVLLTDTEKSFIEKFAFYKQFDLISQTDKQKILSIFDLDIAFLQNNPISVLLPNSLGFTFLISQKSNGLLKDVLYTADHYAKVYITLVDYFLNPQNKIMYNPHPDKKKGLMSTDTFANRGISTFDINMPAEFLRWIPNFRIKQALSVKSSSTEKLSTIIDENISLDWGFAKSYAIMDRLYVVQKLASLLPNHSKIKFYGVSDKTCEMLYKHNFDDYLGKSFELLKTCKNLELQNTDICIINSTLTENEPLTTPNIIFDLLEKTYPNSVVFFTNIFNESTFIPLLLRRKFLLDFIVPIQIQRTPLDDGEQVGDLGTIAIFAFCKNAEIRQLLTTANFTKPLKYLNVLLKVSEISEETAKSHMQAAYNNAVNSAAVSTVLNATIKQKEESLGSKPEEIRQKQEIIQRQNGEIQQKNEMLHLKDEEIEHLKNRITALESSTSWKITQPLRAAKLLFGAKS
ncbi:MAG: hypothetical protein FWG64_13900 [Firmicutes bacterium]|nr:hypothetical protein [Bacillota bacterium]